MNLTLIAALISGSVAGAVGFSLAWKFQDATILRMENDAKDARILAGQVARKAIERTTTGVIVAQNNAAARGHVRRVDADAGRVVVDGLQDATTAALRAATADLAACTATASTLGVISNQCSTEYSTLATDAQGHVSDIQTLTEGWPK